MTARNKCVLLLGAMFVLVAMPSNSYAQAARPGVHRFAAVARSTKTRRLAKAPAQATTSTAPTRDAQAVTLANQSLKALTGGLAITDATVQGSSSWTAGSDQQSGTATLEARAGYQSRMVLALSGGQRTVVRNGSTAAPKGKWSGPDAIWHAMALHNCWADSTWFYPALTIQSALNDPQISFAYTGADTKAGVAVQHIQISRVVPGQIAATTRLIQLLSRADIYVDSATYLPVTIDFNEHPDFDLRVNVPVEIQFAGWHAVNGVQAPSRIQKFVEGSLSLDLSGLSILVNTGIPQNDFAI